jgi:DNA-binding MarR family transcriptional regulator
VSATKRKSGRVPTAWVRLLRVHATLTRELDARLAGTHGLSLSAYEALLFLSWAPGRRLAPSELSSRVLLTASGVTRLLAGLERDGLVRRVPSDSDGRVVYAELTDGGFDRLAAAARDHVDDVHTLFADRLTERQLDTLADLLSRLPGGEIVPDREHPVR